MATVTEVAQWMVDTIKSGGAEYQEVLVHEIERNFGPEWVCVNNNGNPAISDQVLRKFRQLHAGSIEWDRSERRWSTV